MLYALRDTPITVEEVIAAVTHEGAGGLVTFTGQVRRHSRGQTVERLEYEAYAPMAEAKMRALGDEAQARWPGIRCAILHRSGVLAVGEIAVVIAVAAPHRAEAFDACEHLIDRLKEEVPIWKKEIGEDGSEWIGMGP